MPSDITLHQLHRTMQTVMGWTDSHLRQFVFKTQKYCGIGAEIIAERKTRFLVDFFFVQCYSHSQAGEVGVLSRIELLACEKEGS